MIKKLQDKGKARGFKRTPQRMAILEFLDGNTAHPSAEDIYKAVSQKHRSMSFATVYNTLNTLEDAGAVRGLTIDPDRRRFDPNVEPHHHIICQSCKCVRDVHDPISVAAPPALTQEFLVLGSHVEFFGYCPACRKKRPLR